MTKTKSIYRCVAVLKLPTNVSLLISYLRGILKSMTNNSNFPNAAAAITGVTADVVALEAAEIEVRTGLHGAAEKRDKAKTDVIIGANSLQAIVQGVADQDLENARSIIISAGMGVKEIGVRTKPDFEVKRGVSGTLLLVVKSAGPHSAYKWQMSLDEKTWTDLPVTVVTTNCVTGLQPGTFYYFRYLSVTSTVTSEWSQIICEMSL